jgi:hypothetical protein
LINPPNSNSFIGSLVSTSGRLIMILVFMFLAKAPSPPQFEFFFYFVSSVGPLWIILEFKDLILFLETAPPPTGRPGWLLCVHFGGLSVYFSCVCNELISPHSTRFLVLG